MRFKRFEIALICAVLVSYIAGFVVDCQAQARELSDKLIRLHVVANSDSEADQAMKLAVRDAVLEVIREELKGTAEVSEAREWLAAHRTDIEAIGEQVVREWGADYTVSVSLCREDFPTTEYDNFSLPAGEYESLRIKIGKAEGHNWWCVVFPPVCDQPVIDGDTADAMGLTGGEVELITQSGRGVAVRFKTIELINKFLKFFK